MIRNPIIQQNLMKRYISMFLVLGATVAAILYLVFTSGNNNREIILGEKVIEKVPVSETDINTGQIIDATQKKDIKAKEGYRYKVYIQELSKEGTAGIARIGRMITFVPNVKKGDVAIVQITRVSRTTATAELIKIVKSADIKKDIAVGDKYFVTIEQKDRKNPDKNGVVRINGLVVFVPNTQPGDKVEILITERRPTIARAKVIK